MKIPFYMLSNFFLERSYLHSSLLRALLLVCCLSFFGTQLLAQNLTMDFEGSIADPYIEDFYQVIPAAGEGSLGFAAMYAQGDEADSDGTVDGYVVGVNMSGRLKIGADAGSATVVGGANLVIDVSNNAYWTPSSGVTGTGVAAFTVAARDNDGAQSAGSITVNVDTAPPVFESTPSTSNVQDLYSAINLDLDESGTVYYIVLADGANAPTSAEIKAGIASGGSAAILSGNKVLSESPYFSGIADIAVLTPATNYDVYVAAEDVNTNLQASPIKVDVFTAVASTDFRWTSATKPLTGIVEETVNGVTATVTSSGANADFGTAGNQFGTTYNLASVNAPVTNITVSFSSAVNLTSLRVVNFSTKDWILTPTGGSNAVVNSPAPLSSGSEVVNLNWIGVTSFTLTESLGATVAFIIDDIIVNPADLTAPTNQAVVYALSSSVSKGASVAIVSSADITNQVWFAPSGTITFTEGAIMTKSTDGTSTTILAPATVGTYKLYVIDAASNISDESTATLTVTNDIPTLTVFADAVIGTDQDTEGEITFAVLNTQGDEADSDGTVDAYVVKSVTSGTLTIGADVGSAMAYATSTNDIINANNNAYWTPASGVIGIDIAAFAVVAQDDDGAESASSITVNVDVNDVTDPVFTSLTTATFAENGTGTAYTIVATDASALTYSFGTGNDEGLFNLNGGVVTFKTAPDFENPTDGNTDNAYVINVIASDGINLVNQTVIITITDVDEILPVFTSLTTATFAENGTGTAYIITATDANALTYSLGTGNDEAFFDLNGGVVSFKTAPDLETKGTYTLQVNANDGLNTASQTVIITITDVDEIKPVFTSATTLNFVENGTSTAYTIAATDANALTYSLGTGNDEDLFDLNGGLVTFKTTPDFENPTDGNTDNAYVINVIASDGINSVNQNVTISVTDVDDTDPVFTSLKAAT
ncbi:MAG: ribosomal protein L27, partial [Paraglaciecola sp.]